MLRTLHMAIDSLTRCDGARVDAGEDPMSPIACAGGTACPLTAGTPRPDLRTQRIRAAIGQAGGSASSIDRAARIGT
ncbi:hypothetical protein MESS2_860019 [Mesorhizobium metallidurans STM 2683]|uniref:Uncharacterized protein n=1 Tax=Mesorhizobium metallidurans STM 2683 TaxID=1297569 RepID=M5FB41_9HYPH|nr:hypothetical protein MESS2_860019 [Mesorhizobium metallidurans STM 2683]